MTGDCCGNFELPSDGSRWRLIIPVRSPFKHLRLSRDIVHSADRRSLRYPLSYQDVLDLPAERGVTIDRSTVYRRVQKLGSELTKRTERHQSRIRTSTASGTSIGRGETN